MMHLMARFAVITASPAAAATSQAHGPLEPASLRGRFSGDCFTNPAGMTRLEGTQMTLNGILAVDFSSFEVDENVTTVDGGNPRDPQVVPGPFFFTIPVSSGKTGTSDSPRCPHRVWRGYDPTGQAAIQ